MTDAQAARAASWWLAIPIVLAPLALGSMRPVPVTVLCVLGAVALTGQVRCWRPRTRGVPIPVFAILLLIPVLACWLQVLPLPRSVVAVLSPGVEGVQSTVVDRLLPSARSWLPLSFAPRDTALSAGRWTAVLLIGMSAWLAARREPRAAFASRAVGWAMGLTLAVVGAHALFGLERIYGIFPTLGRGISLVQGPFVNSNHLGAFFLLTVPLAAGRALRASPHGHRPAWLLLGSLGSLVALATLSRAVMIALPPALLLVVVGERLRGPRGSWRRILQAGAVASLGLVSFAAIIDAVSGGKLRILAHPQILLRLDDRADLLVESAAILRDALWTGIGPGSFVDLHFRYALEPQDFSVHTAHSLYLQLLLDFGVLVGGALLLGLAARTVILLRRVLVGEAAPSAERGVVVGLLALLAQNVLGFSLLIPGIAVPAVAMAASVEAAHARPARLHLPGRGLIVAAVLLALSASGGALWAQLQGRSATAGALNALLAERPVDDARRSEAAALAARAPADPWGWRTIAVALLPERPRAALPFLNAAMQLDPQGAAPHWTAAEALGTLGLESQALIEYRLALERAGAEFPGIVDEVLARYPDPRRRCSAAPPGGPPRRRYARALARLGETSCALDLAEAIHRDDPGDEALALLRAELLLAAARDDEAAQAASALIDTEQRQWAHTVLARVAGQAGASQAEEEEWRRALDAAEGAARLGPLSELARLAKAAGRSDALRLLAAQERTRSDLGSPVLARCLFIEASAAELDGDLEAALRLRRRAQALDPDVAAYADAVERLRGGGRGGGRTPPLGGGGRTPPLDI